MWRTSIAALFFLLVFFVASVVADVKVNLPDTTCFPTDTVNIPIKVSDLSGLGIYSCEFKLNFDPKVVHFIGVDSAKTLTEAWGATWINSNNPDLIIIGNYGVNPLKNSGVLIFLRVAIIGQIGDSTRLDLQDFQFNSGNPGVLVDDGSIKIIPNSISVSFRATVTYPVKILIDNIEKSVPFDTTWYAGEPHLISTITPQYRAENIRYIYKKWSDEKDTTHVVIPVSDTTFTLYMYKQYQLLVQSEYGHASGGGWYISGTMAEFTADSLIFQGDTTRHVFKSWQGEGINSYSGPQRTMRITMINPVTETAQWGVQHQLQVQSRYGNPVGAGWYDRGDTIAIGIDSLVVSMEGTRHRFDSWSGKGNGSYTGKSRTPNVILLAPITEKVLWSTEHYLWINSNPGGLIQNDKAGWYPKNAIAVTNKADAVVKNDRYVYGFQNWSVDARVVADNPAQISMDTSHTAVANYKIDSVFVKIETNVEKRTSVYVDGVRHAAPYEKFWRYKTKHTIGIDTLQLAADFKTRFKFVSWSDNGLLTHTVTADSALTLKALLMPQYFLSVETYPAGLIEFAEKGWYNENSSVRSTRAPEIVISGKDTFKFKGWYLDDKPVSGNPLEIMMDSPHSVIALYKDLYFIQGRITDSKGNRIPGVRIILSGAVQDTFEISPDSEYYFNFLLPANYTVMPVKDGFRFEPPFRQYPLLEGSLGEENFIGTDLIEPKIKLIYPNGGQNFVGGATDSVAWQAEDNMGIDSIRISFSEDGIGWKKIAVIHPGNQAKYQWQMPNITSSKCKVRVYAVDYDGNLASDESESYFTITANTSVLEEANESVPEIFEVRQNYPNPFNGFTSFCILLPEPGEVKVRIFNVVGQEIATLFDGKLNAGRHKMIWDGKDNSGKPVSSGVYFYQAEMSSQVVTRKLLYLR
jgi:hypothetical protein